MSSGTYTTDANIPGLEKNTGKGMRCGQCLKSFKSYLQLKAHQANSHGQLNEFTKYSTNEMSRTNRESLRKEKLHINEEALKDEISRIRQRN